MRLKNENERFRKELSKSTALLNSASLDDLDRVASEVGLGIGSLLNDLNKRHVVSKSRIKINLGELRLLHG